MAATAPSVSADEHGRSDVDRSDGSEIRDMISKQHTETAWNSMYPHIVRLYLGEQRTLGEVMQIMETHFRFRATQSMYKKRIGKWQLHKYKPRRRTEKAELMTARSDSGIRLTSRRQELARIAPHSVPEVPSVVPMRLTDVDGDREVGMLLSNMRQLTFMTQRPAEYGELEGVGIDMAPSGILSVTQLYVMFTLGSALFARGQGRQAGKAIRRAFLILEDVVRGNHFGLDWLLLDLLYDLVTRGQDVLFTTLVTHLADITGAMLPAHHPTRLIANQLRRYGHDNNDPRDVATLLQRAFYSKVDAVQSDPDVRNAMVTQNRRISELLISGQTPQEMDPDTRLIIKGMRATHIELESQKEPFQGRNMYQQQDDSTSPLSPPGSSPSSSSSASSPSSLPSRSLSPQLPSPTPSFAGTGDIGGERHQLTSFIETRTRRSLGRMTTGPPDTLTLHVADRLFFSEYSSILAGVYRRKGLSWECQQSGTWPAAVSAQRELIAFMIETTPFDPWGIIRELWALEKILIMSGDATEQELDAVTAEVDARVTALLDDIPDDAP